MIWRLLFRLIMGHAVADFALQSPAMARGKNFRRRVDPDLIPPGQTYDPAVWVMYLTAHALIHGAAVFVVTGLTGVAAAEIVAHWLIDLGKCDNIYGIRFDQLLHITMKLMWVVWVLA